MADVAVQEVLDSDTWRVQWQSRQLNLAGAFEVTRESLFALNVSPADLLAAALHTYGRFLTWLEHHAQTHTQEDEARCLFRFRQNESRLTHDFYAFLRERARHSQHRYQINHDIALLRAPIAPTRFNFDVSILDDLDENALNNTAAKKAEELLLRFLSEDQKATFKKHGFFEMVGKNDRRYRLEGKRTYNIIDLQTDTMYCAGPSDKVPWGFDTNLPLGDHLLAQKFHLETDPETFLKKANKSHRSRPDFDWRGCHQYYHTRISPTGRLIPFINTEITS